jgi:uncharacterized protein YlxW (UPF0749 family)
MNQTATDPAVQATRRLANAIIDLCNSYRLDHLRRAEAGQDTYAEILAALSSAAATVIDVGGPGVEHIFQTSLKSSLARVRNREP